MTERILPPGSVPGRQTPSFTEQSVPAALLRAHHTTVWAELVVESGALTFVEEDPPWRHRLLAPATQVIVPNRKHHVEPEPGVQFHVQFYDDAGGSDPVQVDADDQRQRQP